MKTMFAVLGICVTLSWFSYAEESNSAGVGNITCITNADQAAYYATLNQRVLEFKTQANLLNHLAQELKKRAQEPGSEHGPKSQWEDALAKELADRAAAILPLLSNASQERLAFEQAHPDLLVLRNIQSSATGGSHADAIIFLGRLQERLASVQQEIAQYLEAGKHYSAELLTNNTPQQVLQTSALLQANSDAVKRLQREVFDLELRRLEFQALRRD
jgi:hypothetical protein